MSKDMKKAALSCENISDLFHLAVLSIGLTCFGKDPQKGK
jgi:hypothetical protein